ncbi:MAG TPA: lipocalin-like domain-containing protein [Thermoanaerobaculia bacterium]|nr:lipocalin-like domain-containing protein [Thermoanaerobaculia bacterium]
MRRILAALLLAAAPASGPIEFPRDHGAHADAALEWWYYTGHLQAPDGRAFGFQLTFFRARELYLAHFAWTDAARGTFTYDEKAHLGLPGIAGASASGLDVSNEDWFAREENGVVHLSARAREVGELDLRLTPSKPPVLHGEAGLSKKGPGENEYSRYVSITRFAAAGTLVGGGRTTALSGTAWFDHEWGPGALPAGTSGWDWFAFQLSDGSDLMLYRMRRAGNAASPFSAGTFVPADGTAPKPIAWSDVTLVPKSAWASPRSHAVYPAVWSVAVRSLDLAVTVTPLVADQELVTGKSTGVTYWEGACRVDGTRGGRPVGGRAYVEMTGYAGRDVPGFLPP